MVDVGPIEADFPNRTWEYDPANYESYSEGYASQVTPASDSEQFEENGCAKFKPKTNNHVDFRVLLDSTMSSESDVCNKCSKFWRP